MAHFTVTRRRIGIEDEPLVVIDGFAADPESLRSAAKAAQFVPAGHHYPGIRAPLPATYLRDQLPAIARGLGRDFGPVRRLRVLDAQFAIVTTPPDALHIRQRVPHVDAYGRDRIALVHYLSPTNRDGTAFFRHRESGFETIDDSRAAGFFERLAAETHAAPPDGYVTGDGAAFERTARVDGQYNRALLYRSYVLHSGAIAADAQLSPNPMVGRLTITAFLAIE